MDTQGQQNADWGYQQPAPGWYLMKFVDGVEEIKKEEGDKVRISLKVPLVALETYPEREASDFKMSVFVPLTEESDRGIGFAKKKMADILVNAGIWEAFEKQYPGKDVSILDKRIIEASKLKLPDKQVMVKVEETVSKKDNKTYTNIVRLAPSNFKPEDEEKGKANKAQKEKKDPAASTAATASTKDNDWPD